MWRRFYLKPFEAFVGLFVIINGVLTLTPWGTGSAVKDNLWNLLGVPGIAIPVFEIVAGLAKLIGIAWNKANIEAAGLIMVATIFFIRAIVLISDGDISPGDINSEVIALGIIISNIVRLTQITSGKHIVIADRRVLTSLELGGKAV